MFFLPEFPCWLLSKGENVSSLQGLARVLATRDDQYVRAEYAEIKERFEWEQTVRKPSYFAWLFSKKYARRSSYFCWD